MLRTLPVVLLSFGLFAAEPRVYPHFTSTQTVEFAPTGTIRIDGLHGPLFVEAWSRPEVELTVTRTRGGFYSKEKSDRLSAQMQAYRIQPQKSSPNELSISVPKTKYDVEMRLRVPAGAHLHVHQRSGQVQIVGLTGPIDARTSRGDVMVMLPAPGPYNIDARTRLGTVYSDFAKSSRATFFLGQRSDAAGAPARRVFLRTGIGGISVQEIPAGGF